MPGMGWCAPFSGRMHPHFIYIRTTTNWTWFRPHNRRYKNWSSHIDVNFTMISLIYSLVYLFIHSFIHFLKIYFFYYFHLKEPEVASDPERVCNKCGHKCPGYAPHFWRLVQFIHIYRAVFMRLVLSSIRLYCGSALWSRLLVESWPKVALISQSVVEMLRFFLSTWNAKEMAPLFGCIAPVVVVHQPRVG